MYRDSLTEKLKESLGAVLPIVGIVLFLAVTVAPVPNSILLSFLFGGVLLVVRMMFFTLGAELAMRSVDLFLDTEFAGGRHARRIAKIAELEK